jgi:capsular exopolysaccharide synthesis family protein
LGKVIFLTSARPSEGKSLTAANLTWAFQSMGARTLLVDLDFRRGRVHRFFKGSSEKGLCQVLTGESRLEDVTMSTRLPLMKYISRGPTINGSSELLCRLGIEGLVEQWRKQYDWIILDSPPVLGLSETTTLQRVADAVVMVVRAEQTSVTDVKSALVQLIKANAKIVGFVLNSVDMTKMSNYYNNYYYSQHYYDTLSDDDATSGSAKPKNPSPWAGDLA